VGRIIWSRSRSRGRGSIENQGAPPARQEEAAAFREPDTDTIAIVVAVPSATTCEHCQKPFGPRKGNGGSKQRFCSTACRKASNKAQRPQYPAKIPTLAPTPKVDRNEFDWRDDDVVVVRQQMAIAVYTNPSDDVVIRQEGLYGTSEDSWIVISRQNLVPLISALQRLSAARNRP
jgi:hypothetical protein